MKIVWKICNLKNKKQAKPGLTRETRSPCHDIGVTWYEIEKNYKANFLKIIIMLNNEDEKRNKLKKICRPALIF